ncbi:MAG: TIGR01777 family protein [Candidatus Wildermuthbacteria bacterium]|nr:TIGR01777 family protein [Candidatus Wildermuthbacteria bacterium]
MKVIITGGSGFIGQSLAKLLKEKGHSITIWDLKQPKEGDRFEKIDLVQQEPPLQILEGVDGIIHLLGKNIFGKWTKETKQQIYDSRIKSTKNLVLALTKLNAKPKVLISASAVGYYGNRGEEELTENSPAGNDFLAHVASDWEAEAKKAEALGIRTVQIRTALVLGAGGLLEKLIPLYKWELGGPIGSGNQWFPWVHIQDLISIYAFAVENNTARGPLNTAAPQQVRNKEFSKALGEVLHRPSIIPTPKFALRLLYGDFADAITASQRVSSQKLQTLGYTFLFPNLNPALQNILK